MIITYTTSQCIEVITLYSIDYNPNRPQGYSGKIVYEKKPEQRL